MPAGRSLGVISRTFLVTVNWSSIKKLRRTQKLRSCCPASSIISLKFQNIICQLGAVATVPVTDFWWPVRVAATNTQATSTFRINCLKQRWFFPYRLTTERRPALSNRQPRWTDPAFAILSTCEEWKAETVLHTLNNTESWGWTRFLEERSTVRKREK